MRAHVIAIGLVMSLAAGGGAVASSWHWGKAATRDEAMREATDKAQASAKRRGTCFRPAVAISKCQATEDGFRCRADSAADRWACGVRDGWVLEASRPPLPYQFSRWTSPAFTQWAQPAPFTPLDYALPPTLASVP